MTLSHDSDKMKKTEGSMRDNICKFVPAGISEQLSVSCFIYESDEETMKKTSRLSLNIAILAVQGRGNVRFDSTALPFSPGTLVFGFEGESFSVEPEEACEYMYIKFSGLRAAELFRRFDIREENRCFSGFDGLIPLWKESLGRASEETVDLSAESMLLYAFSRLRTDLPEKDGIVRKIIEISEKSFTDSTLSITAVADTLGYNGKYLSHIFREKTGVRYSEYLRSLRIKYAVSLIEHGIDSVKNVAVLSGFSDPMYFSTVFKDTVGISPKEYRSNLFHEE